MISSFRARFGCIGTPLGVMDPKEEKMIRLLVGLRVRYDKFSIPWGVYELSSTTKTEILDTFDELMKADGITSSGPEFEKYKIIVVFFMVVYKHRRLLSDEDYQQLWAAMQDLVPYAIMVPKLNPCVVYRDEKDDY